MLLISKGKKTEKLVKNCHVDFYQQRGYNSKHQILTKFIQTTRTYVVGTPFVSCVM